MQPKQFWTKLAKVIIGFIIAGGIIASIVLVIISKGQLWWLLFAGPISTFIAVTPIGMFTEISENIAAQTETEHSEEASITYSDNDPYSLFRNSSTPVQAEVKSDNSVNTQSALFKQSTQKVSAASASPQTNYEKKDYWICPACGEFNNLDTVICKRCDKQVWVCPKCGEGNDFDSTACSKCDWEA